MSSTKLQTSLAEGNHKKLNDLVGEWKGITKTWFQPGDPVDESPMEGWIKPLFDGRVVQHLYKGSFQGEAFEGIAIYGYHIKTGNFQCTWMDTFHMGTGIMLSEGEKDASAFSVKGTYQASAEDTTKWGWRTEIKMNGSNELVITAYNISPGGEETKATETVYNRK